MAAAYICVYRHFFPKEKDIRATRNDVAGKPDLLRFIDAYVRGKSFFDWGDDPSFFSAIQTHGSAHYAAWGVCRPNVRKALEQGDIVVFFCAKRTFRWSGKTHYHFIGVGTVAKILEDRRLVWSQRSYKLYRQHHNILAKLEAGRLVQHETFRPHHKNWRRRLSSPYVLFNPEASRFNLDNPIHVATSINGRRETWHSNRDQRVAHIEKLLFTDTKLARRLRTSPTGFAHPHINLTRSLAVVPTTAEALRDALFSLV